ncbi:hypothetical protein B0H14DRAFT_2363005, partial [Mycena olivaceomarginata]
HKTLRDLKRKQLHIAWVPSHRDVEGNEAVDGEAKRTAQLPHTLRALHDLPISIAAMKASHKKRVARNWGDA